MADMELKLVPVPAGAGPQQAGRRTHLDGLRASVLSMISFGFTIYKFLQVIDEQSTVPVLRPNAPPNVGLVLTGAEPSWLSSPPFSTGAMYRN